MNSILVLNDLPYLKGVNSDVDSVNTINNLSVGALAVTLDGNSLYVDSSTSTEDKKDVIFSVGVTPNSEVGQVSRSKSSVPIPRRMVTNVSYQKYKAPQVAKYSIGDATAEGTLPFLSVGEAGITIKNLSYNHAISTQSVRVSEYKHQNETNEQFLDRLIEGLNADYLNVAGSSGNKFFTATKVSNSGNFAIEIEALNEHVDFGISTSGMFELTGITQIQEPVFSLGKGSDIVSMEKDFSANEGNGGYEKLNDLWFSQPLEASSNSNYDVVCISWSGMHTFPQQVGIAATNQLYIALPTGTAIVDTVLEVCENLFGTAYDKEKGAETGSEPIKDHTDNDPTT